MKKYNWGNITINKEEFVSVPTKWSIIKIKNPDYFEIQSSGIDEFEGRKEYLSTESISGTELVSVQESITFKERPTRANLQPKKKTVYFAKMKDTFKVILPDESFCEKYILSTGFAGLNAKGIESGFVKYVVSSDFFTCKKDGFCMGTTQEAINNRWIREISLPLPPKEKQIVISDYLDKTTKRLNKVIKNKKKQIEIFEEYENTLIEYTVTSGIRNYNKFFDTDDDIFDKYPSDWKFAKLKKYISKWDYGISESLSSEGKIKVITMREIQNGKVIIPEKGCINDVDERLILKSKDLLYNRTNSLDLIGKVGLYEENGEKVTFASYLVRIRLNKSMANPKFFNYLLNTKKSTNRVQKLSYLSINQANFNATRYSNLKYPVPDINEQNRIVDYLDKKISLIQELINTLVQEVQKLEEYKKILINDVVTGKMKVTA